MEGITITREIDALGSFCPGPLMELIRSVKLAQVGDVIAVLSGDQGSMKDIPAWVNKAQQEFVGMEPAASATRFIIRKIR
ncbi:MAG: sulfurtransferase TusA family protein [Chloroflexota bacterium]